MVAKIKNLELYLIPQHILTIERSDVFTRTVAMYKRRHWQQMTWNIVQKHSKLDPGHTHSYQGTRSHKKNASALLHKLIRVQCPSSHFQRHPPLPTPTSQAPHVNSISHMYRLHCESKLAWIRTKSLWSRIIYVWNRYPDQG